jgi:hypothetical protein
MNATSTYQPSTTSAFSSDLLSNKISEIEQTLEKNEQQGIDDEKKSKLLDTLKTMQQKRTTAEEEFSK